MMGAALHPTARPRAALPGSPRLALVLGSGGVRSVAAVGIAEVLARAGLFPDLIVGCSSGAVFGATIAMGMRAQEALAAATQLWSAELTQQRRWRAWPQLLAPRLAGFAPDFSLRDNRLIAERIARAFGDHRLELLPTPLRVAVTDAASGQGVILAEGRVADAVLASTALPLVFPSVVIGGRRLVDGVVSDPLPIAAAPEADVVLALGFRGTMPRRVRNASRLVAQVSTAVINNLMQARIDAARAAGRRVISIELALSRHVGLWETAALPELFEAGRRAAALRLPEIEAALAGARCTRAAGTLA